MDYVKGMWFKTEDEAQEWLDFESGDEVVEQAAYAQPDRFNEWYRWRDEWLEQSAKADDFARALDAIVEVMGYDKGFNEEEWVEWCNRLLPLVQRHGYMKSTVEFI